jgi:hypothetical protein
VDGDGQFSGVGDRRRNGAWAVVAE